MDELSNEARVNESGGEVINESVQNIPGLAPNFDTLEPEKSKEDKKATNKNHPSNSEAYKATSVVSTHQNIEQTQS